MPPKIDRTGHRYGKLTVLKEDPNKKNNRIHWICQCDCGNIISVDSSNINNYKSCGCTRKETLKKVNKERFGGKPSDKRINEIGNKYGRLTVVEDAGTINGRAVWKCLCDCGNEIVVKGKYLRNGDTKSCGCLQSFGEEKIAQILRDNNICFVQEKKFVDCLVETNNQARFDFWVNNEYLIEFDGLQHFKKTGWRSQEEFERDKQRDIIKSTWAKKNNIPLIRIPYDRLNKLTLEDLIPSTSKFNESVKIK